MIEILKNLNTDNYNIICKDTIYYNVKIKKIKNNFVLLENQKKEKFLLNLNEVKLILSFEEITNNTARRKITNYFDYNFFLN